jgi:hypothetical protein
MILMSLTRPSQILCVLIGHSLSASEQRELASRMEKKQMKEFMTVCLLTLRRTIDIQPSWTYRQRTSIRSGTEG